MDGYVFLLVKGHVVCVDRPGGVSFGAITFLELGMTFEKTMLLVSYYFQPGLVLTDFLLQPSSMQASPGVA